MALTNLRNRNVFFSVGALALVVGAIGLFSGGGDYKAKVVLDSATNVVKGGPILVNGFKAGKVDDIKVENGKAVISFSLDKDFAPLHDGATVEVAWKAVLSERQLDVTDGPKKNTVIPDGGMIPGTMPKPTELDDVLNALDPPTRAKLTGVIARLDATLSGNEKNANDTLKSAGPALLELGRVLDALGTDGPAIQNLVQRTNNMLGVVATRDQNVQQIVRELSALTGKLAAQKQALSATLERLPATVDQATATLKQVPSTVDQAEPLLRDLAPATKALGPVAKSLSPVLRDLRPTAANLRPALTQLQALLGVTPGLLDDAHGLLPLLENTLSQSAEPIAFMRPYTPEMMGLISTWGSSFSNYDSNGNYARIHFEESPTSINELPPGAVPSGVTYDPYPAPGEIVNQPWTDAEGSTLR